MPRSRRRSSGGQRTQRRDGIGVAVDYRAVHLLEYYAREFGCRRGDLPVAESIGDRTLSLPFYPQLTDEQIERVIGAVAATVGARVALVV